MSVDKNIWTPSEAWDLEEFGGLKPQSSTDILSRMGHNIALYGKGGAGKTTAASSVKHSKYGKRVLHLDAAGNAHVLAHDPNYKVVIITKYSQIEAFTTKATNNIILPFDVIVFDNMSEIQSMEMLTRAKPGEEEIQHWRKNTAEILSLTRKWKDLTRTRPLSVIFIAWESDERNTEGMITAQRLKFTKALREEFPGIVDAVAYLTVESDGITRKMSFNPHKTDAKHSMSHMEAGSAVPMDLWFRDKPVLADYFNTVIGGDPFPRADYAKPVRQTA